MGSLNIYLSVHAIFFIIVLVSRDADANNSTINMDRWTRIIGGVPAKQNEFPWLVTLQIRIGKNVSFCGGALIAMDKVLTAAHCLRNEQTFASLIKVTAGDHRLSIKDGPEQSMETSSFILHEEFNMVTLINDIALIYLPKSFSRTAAVKPILLPSKRVKCWKKGILAGWGHTQNASPGILSDSLRKVTLPIQFGRSCRKQMISKTKQFCAGGTGKDFCLGDSGSPFMCASRPGTIYGVVSGFSGEDCAVRGWPGFYTRVPAYVSWIKEKMLKQ